MLRRTAAVSFAAVEGFLDRLVCVLGAMVFAQAPEFFQQYLQRLGGHLDQARSQFASFEAAARAAGKPMAQFVGDTLANPEPGIAKLGSAMREASEQVDSLTAAHAALVGASVWSRPFAFLGHLDVGIARGTAAMFKPAVPTTLEGAVYAAVGVALAFGIWHVCIRLPARRFLAAPRVPVRA